MQMATGRRAARADFADLLASADILPGLRLDFGQMPVQRKKRLADAGQIMLDDDQVAVEIQPGAVGYSLPVIPSDDHDAVRCGEDGRTGSIVEFHAVMRLARPILRAAVRIGGVNRDRSGQRDGTLQQEVTGLEAISDCRIAGNGSGAGERGSGGAGGQGGGGAGGQGSRRAGGQGGSGAREQGSRRFRRPITGNS